jgi:hypothetical protein
MQLLSEPSEDDSERQFEMADSLEQLCWRFRIGFTLLLENFDRPGVFFEVPSQYSSSSVAHLTFLFTRGDFVKPCTPVEYSRALLTATAT